MCLDAAGMGVGASSLGSRLIANGQINDVTINDPTIAVPEPSVFWQLLFGAGLLRALNRRRAIAG